MPGSGCYLLRWLENERTARAEGRAPNAKGQQYFNSIESLAGRADKLNKQGFTVFYATASYKDDGGKATAENVKAKRAFYIDLDVGQGDRKYPIRRDAGEDLVRVVKANNLPIPIVISSGGGYHAYWPMSEDIPPGTWKDTATKLKTLLDRSGLKQDRAVTADTARIMRPPGSTHRKTAEDLLVRVVQKPFQVVSLADFNAILDQGLTDVTATTKPKRIDNPFAGARTEFAPPPETHEEIERVKDMLAGIPANCDYEQYRQVVWALLSTGWKSAVQLAHEWAMSAPDRFDRTNFDKVVNSFDPKGGTGFGTLVFYAKQHGWIDNELKTEVPHFTGSGGDVKNGELYAKEYRNELLFIHETNDVLTYDVNHGWNKAPHGAEERRAKKLLAKLREMAAEAYKKEPDSPKTKRLMAHVERTSKAQNLRAMVEMAKSEDGMTVRLGDFDADPMHLGVQNGVLDLRTGKLFPISPTLLVSKRCNVSFDPSATCPKFMAYIQEVQPDPGTVRYFQRYAGYCLTGSVAEQVLLFLYGLGANGKSVFVETMAWILGDYSRKIATEMLMHHQRNPQGPSPDIAGLKGIRFAYANETEEGRRLSEARVKDLTGSDTITARYPYAREEINFLPTHKLAIAGNHKPEIQDSSYGMWRRIQLVGFEVTIPEKKRDGRLFEKLKAEGPGILNWMLDGLQAWRKTGLQPPKSVQAATAAYRDEQDIIGEWIADHCLTGSGCTEKKSDLYDAYRKWCVNNGHHPLANPRLTRRLKERGYIVMPDKRTVAGLTLNTQGKADAVMGY